MELKVLSSEDPAFVLRSADEFLSSEPVLHNLILSILHSASLRAIQACIGSHFTPRKPSAWWFSPLWNTRRL
jgi:hypothetical protein